MPPCPVCGIDEDSISVPDAILAIRSFPRRYREALAAVPPEAISARPDPDTPSVLEHAAQAGAALELLARALPIALETPNAHIPPVDIPSVDGPRAAAPSPDPVDPELVLAGIEAAATALVNRADATLWEAWDRPVTTGAVTHSASWIVQRAAHVGAHQLREIERVAPRS